MSKFYTTSTQANELYDQAKAAKGEEQKAEQRGSFEEGGGDQADWRAYSSIGDWEEVEGRDGRTQGKLYWEGYPH